jgi:hypothetical protein
MGSGGLGIFNGCIEQTDSGGAPQFPGREADWGFRFGGLQRRADCAGLAPWPTDGSPPAGERDLRQLCEAGFDLGLRVDSSVTSTIRGDALVTSTNRVPCPDSLVELTGLRRTDDSESETNTQVGELSSMMDCCKASAAWPGNADSVDDRFPAAHACQADGYTRIPA